MTVKELIQSLSELDQEKEVVIIKDGSIYEIDNVNDDNLQYDPDTGAVCIPKLTDKLSDLGYTQEDVCENGEPIVVIWL